MIVTTVVGAIGFLVLIAGFSWFILPLLVLIATLARRGWRKPHVIVLALALSLAGCAAQAPTLSSVPRSGDAGRPLSDSQIFGFGEALVKWWGLRAVKVEVFSTGSGILLDAMSTAALASTGGGISPDIVRGLVSGVNFITAVFKRVDPGARDNAFNEGSGMVLEAQGEYLRCITRNGNATPSTADVSSCGADLLSRTNSAVRIVGALMAGIRPQKKDLEAVETKP
jgi:hypothetical protein